MNEKVKANKIFKKSNNKIDDELLKEGIKSMKKVSIW